MGEDKSVKDTQMLEILKILAPGTSLREGLEYILKARTGALIVVGDTSEVMKLVDGGFLINKEYSPAHIYELAKMDGAIILGKDAKKIIYANAQLIPDPAIPTVETGTRHRTAERVARQTGELVISVSQRRSVITLYKSTFKYILRDTATILSRANQAIQTLEKYKNVLDDALNSLSINEFYDIVTLENIAIVLQRTEMVMRIVEEIRRYITELGNEGRLVSMQLEELVGNTEKEGVLLIEDYMFQVENREVDEVLKQIKGLSNDELMDINFICKALGYQGGITSLDLNLTPRGFRIMNKLPKLPPNIIKNLIEKFANLQGVLKATIEELDDVDGIGEVRARSIKEGLRRTFELLNVGIRGTRENDLIIDFPNYLTSRRH